MMEGITIIVLEEILMAKRLDRVNDVVPFVLQTKEQREPSCGR